MKAFCKSKSEHSVFPHSRSLNFRSLLKVDVVLQAPPLSRNFPANFPQRPHIYYQRCFHASQELALEI